MNGDTIPWVEKYRPQEQNAIVSHEKIKKQIHEFIIQKSLPNLLFHGPAGVGKTTLIKAIARQLFGDQYQQQIIEINASDENGIDVVRDKINTFVKTKQLFSTDTKIKLIILDECDQMSNVAQGALRRIMELSANTARFCLICNYVSKIIPPLQSRCAVFRFKPIEENYCLQMLQRVCVSESLDHDDSAFTAIYSITQGDMRQAINLLQSSQMFMYGKKMKLTDKVIYEIASRPTKETAQQFLQPMTFKDRYNYVADVLRRGISLEDFIQVVFREIMVDNQISNETKMRYCRSLGEVEEALQIGADLRTQIAGVVGLFGEQ